MKMNRVIILDNHEIFCALKEYIGNHVNGVNADSVCNYRIQFQDKVNNFNPWIEVDLETVET